MKLQTLKSQLIKRLIICAIIIACFVALATAMQMVYSSAHSDVKKLSNEIRQIQSKEKTSRKDFKILQSAEKKYHKTPKHKLPSNNGYINPQERIRAITPILNEIKNKFRLAAIRYSFGGKPTINEDLKLQYTDIYSGKITINIKSLTDEIIYATIKDLFTKLPGYVQLSNLSINKSSTFSPELLSDIRSGKSKLDLTRGEIDIIWHTLHITENQENKK